LKWPISGSFLKILQTIICLNHQQTLYLCHKSRSSLSSLASDRPTTSHARKTPLFRATPGKNSTRSNWNGIHSRSRWTSRKRIRSGFTLAKTQPTQRHSLQRILPSRGTIRKVTSWTPYPSHSLHPGIHIQLHILHQESTRTLLMLQERQAALPCRHPLVDQKSLTSTSRVVEQKPIVIVLIRNRTEDNRTFCRILSHPMPSAQILDGHHQTTDHRHHIKHIVRLQLMALPH
jgi:hypothetical protein